LGGEELDEAFLRIATSLNDQRRNIPSPVSGFQTRLGCTSGSKKPRLAISF